LLIKDMNNVYESVVVFNYLAGNCDEEFTFEQFRNQASRVLEEGQEAYDGANEQNIIECVDGGNDVIVTAFGLLERLTDVVDLEGAFNEVLNNNLAKFTDDEAIAATWARFYEDTGIATYLTSHKVLMDGEAKLFYGVKRKSDNKLLKPPGHPKPNLEKYLKKEEGSE